MTQGTKAGCLAKRTKSGIQGQHALGGEGGVSHTELETARSAGWSGAASKDELIVIAMSEEGEVADG